MDANKLCSYAMSPFLSTSGFKWIDPKDFHLTTGKVTVVTFHHEKLKLYLRLGLKLKKNTSCIRIQSITMAKIIFQIHHTRD